MNRKHLTRSLLISILVGLLSPIPRLPATDLFLDWFDYPDGLLVGTENSLWTAHSQAANGPVEIRSGGMVLRSDGFEDINAPLDGAPYTVDGPVASLYAEFLIEATELPSEAGTYFAHFRSGNTHRARVWISTANATEGTYRLGIGNSSEADAASGQIPQDMELEQNYRVVFRYQLATGLSSIALNPVTEADLTAVAQDPVGLSSVSSIAFRQAAEIGLLRIDHVRITDTFPGEPRESVRLEFVRWVDGPEVRWPAGATNAVLQSTPSLDDPSWIDEEGPIQSDGAWSRFLLPETVGQRFYRLRWP